VNAYARKSTTEGRKSTSMTRITPNRHGDFRDNISSSNVKPAILTRALVFVSACRPMFAIGEGVH
jgi:hypothetical protein